MALTQTDIQNLIDLETQLSAKIKELNTAKFPEANTDYFLAQKAALIRSTALTAILSAMAPANPGTGTPGTGTPTPTPTTSDPGTPLDGGDPGGDPNGTPTGRLIILGDSQQTTPPNTGGVAASQRMGLGFDVEVVNLSIAGKTLRQFADDMEASVAQDVNTAARDKNSSAANFNSLFDSSMNVTLFVTLGTNDPAVFGGDGPAMRADARRIVVAAHARGARVVFATVPTRGDSFWTAAMEAARLNYNAALRVNSIGHNGYADWAQTAPVQEGADTSNTQVFNDKLHYQPAVQAVLAPVAAAAVKRTLTGSPYPYTIYATPRPTTAIAPITFSGNLGFRDGAMYYGLGTVPTSVQPLSPPTYWSVESDMTFADGFNIALSQNGGWWMGHSGSTGSWVNNIISGLKSYDGGAVGAGEKHTLGMEFSPAGVWLFLDGIPLGIITGQNVTNAKMLIGAYDDTGAYRFTGTISKVRLYNGRRWTGIATRRAYYPLATDGSGTT